MSDINKRFAKVALAQSKRIDELNAENAHLHAEIERLKVEIELRDVVISDVRDALEGRR